MIQENSDRRMIMTGKEEELKTMGLGYLLGTTQRPRGLDPLTKNIQQNLDPQNINM